MSGLLHACTAVQAPPRAVLPPAGILYLGLSLLQSLHMAWMAAC